MVGKRFIHRLWVYYNLGTLEATKDPVLTNPAKPIYDSAAHALPALSELRELRQYRFLLFQLIRRDLVARYKRSILGVAWTMLNPLGTMLIMTLVFSNLFKSVESYPGLYSQRSDCVELFSRKGPMPLWLG
jgi:ABC-type polysaccharide/polyol phosphate export systems, permease component